MSNTLGYESEDLSTLHNIIPLENQIRYEPEEPKEPPIKDYYYYFYKIKEDPYRFCKLPNEYKTLEFAILAVSINPLVISQLGPLKYKREVIVEFEKRYNKKF